MKRLDSKLATIRTGDYQPGDFIIADAKDADMGGGAPAPGPRTDGKPGFKTRAEYLDAMRRMTASDLVDVMLMSASNAETLVQEGIFDNSAVTPAVRLNDATDIWNMRHGGYTSQPALNFATARLSKVREFADLGLFSVTFTNDNLRDVHNLEAYAAFREAADGVGMRHFLEVFNPNVDIGIADEDIGSYVTDCILKALAGITASDRPLFLKVAYNGPQAMSDLAGYDPTGLIVGVLGGGKGTTRDTFELVDQASRHGARVALFGRKINLAEAPEVLVSLMRRVVEGDISPEEAVRHYHNDLTAAHIEPHRSLEADLEITEPVLKAG